MYSFSKAIFQVLRNYQPFFSTHQKLMSVEEKRIREKINLDLSVRRTKLDSTTFWLFYNISKNLLHTDGIQDKDWVVFDIGASNGWFTEIFSKFCSKNTEFIMFEPQEVHKVELEEFSRSSPNFTFFPFGLGMKKGKSKFFNNTGAKGLSSQFNLNENYVHFGESKFKETTETKIEVLTLQDFLSKNEAILDKNIMLKMDTQGAEFGIIKGCGHFLKYISVVYMELQLIDKYDLGYSYLDVFNFMSDNNFTLFDINPTFKEINGKPHSFGWEGHLNEAEFVFTRNNML